MDKNKIIYYSDELNEEFSEAKIEPRIIDENYIYNHKNLLWKITSLFLQNVLTIPIKYFYLKLKFKHKFVGKEKLKKYRKQGYFIYVNHTQAFADTMIPSMANFLYNTNYFIVNPENVSMKGLGNLVQMLGAIPLPSNRSGMKNFRDEIDRKIEQGKSITIYPEAHIWPYYTKIRPFKNGSFKYPIELNCPCFCITNTYQSYGKNNKVKITSYIDGPFFADDVQGIKEKKENLRNKVYEQMQLRSKNSNFEYIKYVRKESANVD